MVRARSKNSVKAASAEALALEQVEPLIHAIRGEKVILDSDLARLYGVTAKRLNEQVKRNRDRFPADFMFQLTAKESATSRLQIATSSLQGINPKGDKTNWSQIATSSRKHRGIVYRPYAFTEHGAIMTANVLNSPRAVQMSVFVVRAFLKMMLRRQAARSDIHTRFRRIALRIRPQNRSMPRRLRVEQDDIDVVMEFVLCRVARIIFPPVSQPRHYRVTIAQRRNGFSDRFPLYEHSIAGLRCLEGTLLHAERGSDGNWR